MDTAAIQSKAVTAAKIADGRLTAEKCWISQNRADDAVKAFDDLKPLPVEITPAAKG